jgi:hypothetical protein
VLRCRSSEIGKRIGCRWTTVTVDMCGELAAGVSLGKQRCAHGNGQEYELKAREHDQI